MLTALPLLLQAVGPLTRDGARRAAQHELSKQVYQQAKPPPVQRLLSAFLDWVNTAMDRASAAAPGGLWGLLGLLLLLVAAIVAVRLAVGPLSRTARLEPLPDLAAPLGPADHRRLADEHAAAGRYAEAVRERLRAVVGELEARAVLEPRAGRTAAEVAAEAGHALPVLAEDLRSAAAAFDAVWYGGRPASAAIDAQLRRLDERVRHTRLVPAASVPSAASA